MAKGSSRGIGPVVDVDLSDTELEDSFAEGRAAGFLISLGFKDILCLACQYSRKT